MRKYGIGLGMLISLIAIDYIQYNMSVNENIYAAFCIMLMLLALISNKINTSYVVIFVLFLLFQDISRFFYNEHNFNSIFFGNLKYIFMFFTLLIGAKKKAFCNKDFLIYFSYSIFVFLYSLIQMRVGPEAPVDIVFYFNMFLLPFLISYVIDAKTGKKILDVYSYFVYVFPFYVFVLLLLGRTYEFVGSSYVVVGNITMMNIAYIIGLILKGKKKKLNYLMLLVYSFVFMLAPNSGAFILAIILIFYYVLVKTKEINIYLRGAFLLGVSLVVLLIVNLTFNWILESPDFAGTFIRYKIVQIVSIFDYSGVRNLPFSVMIRMGQIPNVIYSFTPIEILIGRGFGGYYYDIFNLFSNVKPSDSAFGINELASGQYYQVHISIIKILLKFGIIGIFLFGKYVLKVLRELKRNFSEYIPVFIVVIYGSIWGIKVLMIFGFLIGSVMRINRDLLIKSNSEIQ